MTFNRLRRIELAAIAAVAAFSTLWGCGPGASVESVPRTAADAGREVFRPGTPSKTEAGFAAESPNTEPAKTTATPTAPVETAPTKPVVATQPTVAEETLLTSTNGASLPGADLTGRGKVAATAPQEDPSRYPGGIVPASPNAKPLPGGPRLLVPEKTFRTEGKPPALRVSYDDLDLLKVLNVDPVPRDVVEQFPDWLKGLDGKQVRLRGFMYPSYEEMQSAFVLARDTGVCCFGPNPKVYYLIGVKMKEGTLARYVENRPIDVVGTFHIQPFVDDEGNWFQLYKISDAAVVN